MEIRKGENLRDAWHCPIRVFPSLTNMTPRDSMAFVGAPPMILPKASEVHVSVSFTWDILNASRLAKAWGQYYPLVKIGGCAYDDPCDDFTPGLYIRHGVTFMSRGCNNQCPWCEVWRREGKLREITINTGNIVQDNNLLQCSSHHLDRVFAMLRTQRAIEFSGGLDSSLLTDDIAEQIRGLKLKQVFLAADTKEAIKPLRKALLRLHLPRNKVRCYVLLQYNRKETISEATERMEQVWQAGAIPFAQLYQPKEFWIDYQKEWKQFARKWSRPAIIKSLMRGGSNGNKKG